MRPDEFVGAGGGAATPNVVTFKFNHVDPPAALYIQRDDVLLFEGTTSLAGDTITIATRILEPFAQTPGQPSDAAARKVAGLPTVGPGYIQTSLDVLQLPTTGSTFFLTKQLLEGYLLSVTVISSSATWIGQTFCRVRLNRGLIPALPGNAFSTLVSGYVNRFQPIGWPGGQYLRAVDGPGFLQTYAPGNPAAGADIAFSSTAAGRARLQTFTATLTTSAVAGNRFPSFALAFSSVPGVQFQVQDTVAVPASTTITYSIAPGGTNVRGGGAPIFATLPVPSPFIGRSGVTVTSSTQGILAGDQWSAIRATLEEWLEIF